MSSYGQQGWCLFLLRVNDVPGGQKFYRVQVAQRGETNYAEAEARAGINLVLGGTAPKPTGTPTASAPPPTSNPSPTTQPPPTSTLQTETPEDSESASLAQLRRIAKADHPFVTVWLADRWVPQISSKRLGIEAEGTRWNYARILSEHLQLRTQFPEARLLWSADWSTFDAPDFWVTIAGDTFPDAAGALGYGTPRCWRRHQHPSDATTGTSNGTPCRRLRPRNGRATAGRRNSKRGPDPFGPSSRLAGGPNPSHSVWRSRSSRLWCDAWQFYQVTGDLAYLIDYGTEMLAEIARFWVSRTTYDPQQDRYHIKGVIGPDEFHAGYPNRPYDGVDNNSYTNVMAVWVIVRAVEALQLMPLPNRLDLRERLGLTDDELAEWERVSRRMFVPFHDGVISQFEGYEQLQELDWEGYRLKYGNIQRLDRILKAEDDDINRYKASKQADALMLLYLLSSDELRELLTRLGYNLSHSQIPKMVDYYMDRTSHGSTLSGVVHTWVLARANRDRAMEFFHQVLESDVADIQGGTTSEGIHLAAMAGSIDLVQRCFPASAVDGHMIASDLGRDLRRRR